MIALFINNACINNETMGENSCLYFLLFVYLLFFVVVFVLVLLFVLLLNRMNTHTHTCVRVCNIVTLFYILLF